MSRRHLAWFVAILVFVAMCAGRSFSSNNEVYEQIELLTRVYFMVQAKYVEPGKVKADRMFQGACRGMVDALNDPHSIYMSMKQSRRFSEDTQGQFGGIGIEIGMKDGILTVISPIAGTPAYEAGLMAGDRIFEIDGKSTERINLHEAVELLRGLVGTPVTLTIRHPNGRANEKVTLTRALIKPASIEISMLDAERKIAYVHILQFTSRLAEEFAEMVARFEKEGVRGLVLDLRDNPGGDLKVAVNVSEHLVAEGTVVTVKYRESEHNEVYAARRRGKLADLPLVCLVNQGSASASEIVAGCLRDHKRALLVGERTFGKGSVQNVFMVGQGTALKLTTARYYTPADKPIEDGKGIVPDIVVPMTAEALMALRTQVREDKLRGKYDPGTTGLNGEDEPPPAKPAKPETKPDAGGKKQATDEPGDEEDRERRERVRDDQLRAALCILLLQMDMAARTPKAAK